MEVSTQSKPIRIDATKEPDARVLVTTKQQDRFVNSVHETVLACKIFDALRERRARFFDELVPVIADWCSANREWVIQGYLCPRDAGFLVVLRCRDVFVRELESAVTALNLRLVRDFGDFGIEALEIPDVTADQLASFVDEDSPATIVFEL